MAGVLLLVAWVGPVTFVQTDAPQLLRWVGAPEHASAYPRAIPAGEALLLEPGTPLELRLRDGSVVKGRFLGRTLLDASRYAQRFAARARSSSYAPFAPGETLHVALRDGRDWALPFAGYGELALLLERPGEPEPLRVPFEFASEIRRTNGDRVDPRTLARAFRAGKLPSAEALVIEDLLPVGIEADRWAAALRVAAEDIQSATVELPSGTSVAGAVVLGVLVGVVVFYVILLSSLNSASKGCRSVPSGSLPQVLAGVHLTTRAFDLDRACYVGDALAVAVPRSGSAEDGPATALADAAPLDVPAR